MALQIFKINEYDYQAERMQFEAICQLLRERYKNSDKECILIGNYNIEGVELDGLLITSGGIRILEFKNWGGNIIARENGEWTSEKKIIEGGAGKKTPYEQIRLNKSRVTKGLSNLLGIKSQQISAAIIFWQNANIDTTSLSETVKKWLNVFDNQNLSLILEGLESQIMTEDFVKNIPHHLRIEDFSEESLRNHNSIINEIYEPEASTNFFDELETALKFRPDYQRTYEAMYQTFRKCLNQKTDQTRITFGGDFAKTDYLLKEYQAKYTLVKATNDTRVHLRNRKELSSIELEEFCLYDLENLCQFIAFIYKAEIPQSLKAEFPKDKITRPRPKLIGEEYLRVIVNNWDDECVYVQSENTIDGEPIKVCYTHDNVNYPYDWSYLNVLFYKNAQLNLIRPRERDGVIYPELIIFEPDYLVNISTVAHCFTSYAESPYVDLIKKLEPQNKPENFLMGNLAGQMLDEAIYQLPNTYSYKNTVFKFFNSNALNILAAEQNYEEKQKAIDPTSQKKWGPIFHEEAQRQKQNIVHALYDRLPSLLEHFNLKNGIVEPSFFSEMLGLQGRIDFLQMDFRVLLEQKAGKGAFPYDNFIKPKQTDEHYIQMLLYMSWIRYNFREIYELNNRELHEFLLYSKYSDSLLGLGFAPELIFNAIKIRNRLAWTEMLYTLPNGYRILDGLKPEKLNFKKVSDSLWDKWLRPMIASILDPIQQASELEKAYYFRFLTFIANEHAMSKLGNKTKECSGFAATWHDSTEEKRQAGNIYDQLKLVSPTSTHKGQVKSVTLKFTETNENDMANFRVGDIVILYPYPKDKEPNACTTIVLRGTIKEITTETITVELRYAQSDNRFFIKLKEKKDKEKLWAIEHDFMESSYSSQYKGMQAFLSAPKERRDLLLLQREPETDKTVELKGDYEKFNELALRVKRAKDLFLIIGPPGTGKTSFGLLNTVKEELMEPNTNILLLSFTNRAVDEICSKLSEEKIDYIRIGGEFNCAEEYRNHLFCKRVEHNDKDKVRTMLYSTRVYVGTTASLLSNILLFQFKQFSLAVIDEASQLLEPHLIGLFSEQKNGIPAIKKFVLIGDHKQLPAVVQQDENISRVQDVLLKDIYLSDCRLSLFERLLKKYAKNKDVTYMLHKQGRMHQDIALFSNYSFYNNQLEMVPLPHQKVSLPLRGDGKNGIIDLLQTRRISFIATEQSKNSPSDKVNMVEANMIAAVVMKIYEIETSMNFEVDSTVGVIVPYRNQITTVRKAIDKYGIPLLHDITIDTVERYQGSQRKYIVYGFTIQQYYQLKFLTCNVFEDEIDGSIVDRKLNVAMTRAKEHLVMFGNAELLSNNFTFFKLIEFVRSKHGFFRISENDFVSGRFQVPQLETDDLDLSKATFTVSNRYNKAFEHHILQPVKEASGNEWPSKVFGNDMSTNLTAIGYGRINFSNQLNMFDEMISPERQVLIYCYYIMRQHYCSSRNLFTSYKNWLVPQINSFSGRVQMIDIGCGPATCGIAFTEIFKDIAPNLVYTGIDVSTEMKRMGIKLWDDVHGGDLHYQMIDSFNALGSSFWEGCSELPSLVIINMSYFFSNVNAKFTERLATQIIEIMKKYPLNQYIFFIQHSECDKIINSYKVFKRIISSNVTIIKDESSVFSYILNYKERTLNFCYTILKSTLPSSQQSSPPSSTT